MITLLPSPSKILEMMVLNSVRKPLELLFGDSQHGFRKNCSTTTALLQITDKALRLFDDKFSVVSIVSLHLSKAFDKVDHELLLTKLEKMLPASFTNWISNYLTGRYFRVRVRDRFSCRRSMPVGVPQGSVLGPSLFCVMVGDFKCVSENSSASQYADDITIVTSFQSSDPLVIKNGLCAEMENLSTWCQANKKVHNEEKRSSTLNLQAISHYVFSHTEPPRRAMKILGVFLKQELTCHHHVNEMCKKTSRRLRISKNKRLRRIDNRAHYIIFGKCLTSCDYPPNSLKVRRESLSKNLLQKLIATS